MQRLKHLRNKYQKRLIRPLYAHTQATPYAAQLDTAVLRDSDNDIVLLANGATNGTGTRSAAAFTLKNGYVPGTVVVRTEGEKIVPALGNDTEVPFGLLANFVGGDLDDIGDENEVGVWQGAGATFELLAPAFDDTGLSAAYDTSKANGVPVRLFAGTDGRLVHVASPTAGRAVVARLVERVNAQRIVIQLVGPGSVVA